MNDLRFALRRLHAHLWSAVSPTRGENGSIGASIFQDCRFAVRAFGRRPCLRPSPFSRFQLLIMI